MKRLCTVLLTLVLFFGLLPGAGAEEEFRFTRENFPKLDGSTSMVPLGEGIASVLLGQSREEAASLISFNRTTQSFRNLREGVSDLVIAAEPKSEVFQEMAAEHFPYEMEQIAKEALVFVVNENNPVNSLTREQVRDIYAGKITNWSQVGGADAPIAAFQRNPTAGSQVMMEKLVMEGTPMMKAPSAMIPEEMGALIESVRSYDNSANAIGYTVFYYAADMRMAQGLKILQIDGITPSAQSLRDETYPFLNGYYACISAKAPKDSPQRILYDWLVSKAGQELLTLEGYVSVYSPEEAPDNGVSVALDYSGYVPNNGTPAQYLRFDCPHDRLEPRDDYGDLFPYDGVRLYADWGDGSEDFYTGSLKGFYNHSGQLITNPIYTEIGYFTMGELGGDYMWVVSQDGEHLGLVAKDGSFATELCYDSIYQAGSFLVASQDYQNMIFQILDWDLNPIATQDDYTFDGLRYIPQFSRDGLTLCSRLDEEWNTEYLLLDENKNILLQTQDYISMLDNGFILVYDDQWNVTAYTFDMVPLELPEVGANCQIESLNDRFFRVYGDAGDYIIDTNGTLFEWDYDSALFAAQNCFTVEKNGRMSLYDQYGRLKFQDLTPDWSYLGDGIFAQNKENELVLHKLPEGKTVSFRDGSFAYSQGECYSVCINTDDRWTSVLLDGELNELRRSTGDFSVLDDLITGKRYMVEYDSYGFYGQQSLLSLDGRTQLFQDNGILNVQGGCITCSNDWAFTCYAPDGSVVFCYPYFGMASGD